LARYNITSDGVACFSALRNIYCLRYALSAGYLPSQGHKITGAASHFNANDTLLHTLLGEV